MGEETQKTQGRISKFFDASDRLTIMMLAVLIMTGSALFYWHLGKLGLLTFPNAEDHSGASGWEYFLSALDFRERRLALMLTFRTFATTLGFIVGLILAAIGGLFVLRRATAPLAASAAGGDDTIGPMRGLKLTIATTSPGIVFAGLGVLVMWFTQAMALPFGAPELFPSAAHPVCPRDQLEAGTCDVGVVGGETPSERASVLGAYCEQRPDDPNCAALNALLGETR